MADRDQKISRDKRMTNSETIMKNFQKAALGLSAALMTTFVAGSVSAQTGAYPAKINFGGDSVVSRDIVLPLNKAAIIELPKDAADVLVSQPDVVNAVVRSPRLIYLMGTSVGQTNVFFFDGRNKQILNLEIRVEQDVDALADLMKRMMPDSRIEVEAVNDNVILRGVVQSAAEAANANALAERFMGNPEQVMNMLSVRDREQVMLKVRIVEMQRQLLKQLGVSTAGTVTLSDAAFSFAAPNGIATTGGLGLSGTKLDTGDLGILDTSLQAFESNGLVRILAEPNLTAISGEDAKFLAGGEFPVPVGQDDGVISIEFKEFGVGLGFTPLVLNKGRINLKIATEVSEITTENAFFVPGATTVDEDGNFITTAGLSIPGLSVRRANTVVELPSGGSLVMAGLLQEDMRQTIEGVPGMKDVPVLGTLFRSRNYANNETELVIIVTPYLVDSTHESNLSDPNEGFVPASDAATILMGKLFTTYGLAGAGVDEASLQGPMGFILD